MKYYPKMDEIVLIPARVVGIESDKNNPQYILVQPISSRETQIMRPLAYHQYNGEPV